MQVDRDRGKSELREVRQQDLLDIVDGRGTPHVRAAGDTHAGWAACSGQKVWVDCLEDEKGCFVRFLFDDDLLQTVG